MFCIFEWSFIEDCGWDIYAIAKWIDRQQCEVGGIGQIGVGEGVKQECDGGESDGVECVVGVVECGYST